MSICSVPSGVLRVVGETAITCGRAEGKEQLDSVEIVDFTGTRRGTLDLFDHQHRALTDLQSENVRAVAQQIGRDLDLRDTHPSWPPLDEAPVAVFCYDVEGRRFVYVNAKFAEILGYTEREVLDLRSMSDIVAEDQREIASELIRRREAGDDRDARYLIKVRCRDGSVLDAEIHSSVAETSFGRLVIGVGVDMTTQVASKRHLTEREEYFRTLTDHLVEVIVILSPDCVLTYISTSVSRVLGYTPDELLGRSTWVTVHPDDAEALRTRLLELTRGGLFECMEVRCQHKDGHWRTLEVTAANLLDHPLIRGLVLNLHDVTDRKRMERELGQLNRLTSLGRLSAQVAHEFNNVMMGIQPMVEAVRRRAGHDATLIRFTDVISASLQRGKRITTDILRFGRPAQPTLRPIEVRDLMDQAADEIRPLLADRVALELFIADPRAHVLADRAQLTQVLLNLAVNARDAMEDGRGTVRLEARPAREGESGHAGAFVHFAVSDTGSGIAANDLPYIFEPLFTTKQRGTGLGLSVVFQVVAAHQGHISVESERGKGTTFHLFIPAVAATAPAEPDDSRNELPARAQPLRVLIVEDENTVARGLRLSLEAAGIDVQTVDTGAAALPAITAFRPDVVVLDLSLPDEDGRAVYQRIAAKSSIPVIFSSGHATENDIAALMASPRTAFLLKPYATEELLETMHRLLADREGSHG